MWRLAFALLLFSTSAFAQNAGDLLTALQISPAVVTACPTIIGASIGNQTDRTTWLGQYASTPSGSCLAAAATVANNLAPTPTSVLIASTATPSLNASYAIDTGTQANIQAISIYITVNGQFPLSMTTMPWQDATGAIHQFPNTATFLAFATQIANYVTAINLHQNLPSTPLQIP